MTDYVNSDKHRRSNTLLGIITALPIEAKIIDKQYQRINQILILANNSVVLCASGIGPNNAAAATKKLISQNVKALVSWGTVGGLQPDVQSGTLIVANSVYALNEKAFLVEKEWQQNILKLIPTSIPAATGMLVHTQKILNNAILKKNLHVRTQGVAVDMESYAIANIARQANIPFLIIRAVVDSANDNIPNACTHALRDNGKINFLKLFGSLISHPHEIIQLLELRKNFLKAKKTLNDFLNAVDLEEILRELPEKKS